jgi:phosphoglycerol geranylgeranyltransferase
MNWTNWKHITKLDPDRPISKETVKAVAENGTDAIMISGTQNITSPKIAKLIEMLKDYKIPKVLEPVHPSLIKYEPFDRVFVPTVINSNELLFTIGIHRDWVKNYEVKWEKIVPEAYIVLNPNSAVGRLTKVKAIGLEETVAYAICAERYFGFPIVYIECSGMYGNPETVRAVGEKLEKATLFYGGGIDSGEKAAEMKKYADAIIVGNVLYEKGIDKYLETIVE